MVNPLASKTWAEYPEGVESDDDQSSGLGIKDSSTGGRVRMASEEDDDRSEEIVKRIDEDGNEVYTSYFTGDGTKGTIKGAMYKRERLVKPVRRVQYVAEGVYRRKNMIRFGYEAFIALNDREMIDVHTATTHSTEDGLRLQRNRMATVLRGGAGAPLQKGKQEVQDRDFEDFLALAGAKLPQESTILRRLENDIKRQLDVMNSSNPTATLSALESAKLAGELAADAAGAQAAMDKARYGDENTLRVANLSDICDEEDLRILFRRATGAEAGRVHLARNKDTGKSKGFAFVTFRLREQAELAIEKLHRQGFQNMILNVEWARPRA